MTVLYHLQGLTFEWDEAKARSNLEKHGVTFEAAAEAFLDPFCVHADASVEGEQRDSVLGYSYSQRLLLVVHAARAETTCIISARPATRAERKVYEHA